MVVGRKNPLVGNEFVHLLGLGKWLSMVEALRGNWTGSQEIRSTDVSKFPEFVSLRLLVPTVRRTE